MNVLFEEFSKNFKNEIPLSHITSAMKWDFTIASLYIFIQPLAESGDPVYARYWDALESSDNLKESLVAKNIKEALKMLREPRHFVLASETAAYYELRNV